MLLTDPPYCLLTRRRKKGDVRDPRGRKIDRDPVLRFENLAAYRTFSEAWMEPALAHVAPNGIAIIWTNFLGKAPILEAAARHGFGERWGEYVWAKRSRAHAGNEELLRVYEVALVLRREPKPPRTPADPPEVWSSITHYEEGEAEATGNHPHHKPFGCLEPLIRAYSRPGDIVLDLFAGSGSIPAAAQALGRQPICLELKPDWADRVTDRLRRSDH